MDRPKTSNGNHRQGANNHNAVSISDEKLNHLDRINQYHKHLEEKKKAGVRPLSGGLQQKMKSENQKSRVQKMQVHQNMSMYEKFSHMGIGGSPERNINQIV